MQPPTVPADGRDWHLTWYGGFHTGAAGRIFVDAVLCAMRRGYEPQLAPVESRSPWALLAPDTACAASVPLSLFARAPIGTLFRGPLRIDPVEYSEYEFTGLDLSPGNLTYLRAAAVPELRAYPFGHHGRAWWLAIGRRWDPHHLLLPASELFRFYFGTSTSFIDAVLRPAFEATVLDLARVTETTGP